MIVKLPNLLGIVDREVVRAIEQLASAIQEVSAKVEELPKEQAGIAQREAQNALQASGLLGILGQPLIGVPSSADPQLASVNTNSGTVTSVGAAFTPTSIFSASVANPTTTPAIALSFLGLPAARVYRSTNQAITTGTVTPIAFDTERRDTPGFHSTSVNTSRVAILETGWHLVGGCFGMAANATGVREGALRVDGATYMTAPEHEPAPSATDITYINLCTFYYLTVGQYVEMTAYHTRGSDLDVVAAVAYSPEMWIAYFGNN